MSKKTIKAGDITYTECGDKPMGGKISTILRRAKQIRQKFPVEIVTANPPCGACDACCRALYIIDFTAGDDPKHFDGDKEIKPNADGTCPYLSNDGCSIYETRPAVCKVYDCRVSAIGGLVETGRDGLNEARRQWDMTTASSDKHNLLHRLCFHTLCHSFQKQTGDIDQSLFLALATYEEYLPSLKKYLSDKNIPEGHTPQLSLMNFNPTAALEKVSGGLI